MNSTVRGMNSNLLIGGNSCNRGVNNNSCVASHFTSVGNSTGLAGALTNPCGVNSSLQREVSPLGENNVLSRAIKNCNAVPSVIIKDLEILDKSSSSSIPSCNLYTGRQPQSYDPSVNSQPVVTDKINYKQSLISTWMSTERDVTPDS